MSTPASWLKAVRLTHLYLGAFFAPSILFFALTGAFQTFSLHETTRGSSYKPPAWIVTLAHIHKKQTAVLPVNRPLTSSVKEKSHAEEMPVKMASEDKPRAEKHDSSDLASSSSSTQPSPKPADNPAPTPHSALPLKIFFLFVSVGLAFSTILGVYMSYKFNRSKQLVTGLLIAGIIVPILLVLI